jgi:nucleoid DNA-binding protein
MLEIPNSISKRYLWRYVNKKISRAIHHYHVFSIITLLFEEILSDLKAGKEIKIDNFGSISLEQMKPRMHFDIVRNEVRLAEGHNILRFFLAKSFKKKLCQELDLDKTMQGEHHE